MQGKIFQINIKNKSSDGIGLPKIPVKSVAITKQGLVGDYNNYRMKSKRGTHDRAILLMTKEKLDEINTDGWPINPGDIGENVLTEGIDYDTIKVGDIFSLGEEIQIQISERCNPCNVLSNLPYIGEDKVKLFIKTMVKRRGWYARVLKEGQLETNSSIIKID